MMAATTAGGKAAVAIVLSDGERVELEAVARRRYACGSFGWRPRGRRTRQRPIGSRSLQGRTVVKVCLPAWFHSNLRFQAWLARI